jgi:hypothetical protein
VPRGPTARACTCFASADNKLADPAVVRQSLAARLVRAAVTVRNRHASYSMSGSPKSPTLLTILARPYFKQMHKWLGLVLTAQHSDSQRHMGTRALQAIFFERFARSVPQFLTGVAPVLPWPTRCFERDARLTPQILKGMAELAASLC